MNDKMVTMDFCVANMHLTAENLAEAIDAALADNGTDRLKKRLAEVRRAEKLNLEAAQSLLEE